MEGYSLHKEHDKHFEVSHAKDGIFKVAKKGLSKAVQDKIRALPKGYVDGGEVEQEDAAAQNSAPSPETPPATAAAPLYSSAGDWDRVYNSSIAQGADPELTKQKLGPRPEAIAVDPDAGWLQKRNALIGSYATQFKNPDDLKNFIDKQIGPRPSLAAATQNQPEGGGPDYLHKTSLSMGEPQEGGQSTQTPAGVQYGPAQSSQSRSPMQGTLDLYNQGFQGAEKAIKEEEAAKEKAATESAKITGDLADQNKTLYQHYQEQSTALEAETKSIQDAILNQKVDPNRLWNNMSTGNKVVAGISMILGGMGAGLTHGPNAALGVIDNAIERDIDSQKTDLGKKQTLLSVNLQKYGRLDQAYRMTSMQLNSVAQAQLTQVAQKSQSALARAEADKALASLKMQQAQLGQQFMMTNMKAGLLTGKVNASPAEIAAYFPDEAQKMVVIDNKPYFAASPTQATDVRKIKENADGVGNALNEYENFIKNVGRTGWGTDAAREADRLRTNVQTAVRGVLGPMRDEETIKKIYSMVPDPGQWRQEDALTAVKDIKNLLNNKLDAFYSTNLPAYRSDVLRAHQGKAKVASK